MNQSKLISIAVDVIDAARVKCETDHQRRILDLVVAELRELHVISRLGYIRRPAATTPPAPARNVIDEINSEIEKLIELVARMDSEHKRAVRFGDKMHDRAVKAAGGDPLVTREFEE